MKSVYALTRIVRGPHGHGEPGQEYIALGDDGNGYVLGDPYCVYSTKEAAEKRLADFGEYTDFEVTELVVD